MPSKTKSRAPSKTKARTAARLAGAAEDLPQFVTHGSICQTALQVVRQGYLEEPAKPKRR